MYTILKPDLIDKRGHSLISTVSETLGVPIWKMSNLRHATVNNQQQYENLKCTACLVNQAKTQSSTIPNIHVFRLKTLPFPPQTQRKEVTSDPNLSNQRPPFAYYVMEFCLEKAKTDKAKGLTRQGQLLQNMSERATNGTHALMTKFGSHYLLVLSIYGAWEAGEEAKPRSPALVLVIVRCLNSVRRGRVREWWRVFGRGTIKLR